MFPDALEFDNNKEAAGKVFSFTLNTAGGAYRSSSKVSTDSAEWDDCRTCPEFDSCYKLCMGRLTLEAVIINE